MKIVIKSFKELTTDELYVLLKLRIDVFVVEQNCPYPELDDKDQIATHILGYYKNKLATYARIFAVSQYFDNHAAIGRIATHKNFRNLKLGRKIVQKSIDLCHKLYGENTPIKIAAQTYLNSFYTSFGFNIDGKEFLEDGLPHVHMVL